MTVQSRKKKHDDKMARKRAAKAAKAALYKSLAGTSKKRKKQKSATQRSGLKHFHAMLDCGNVGCLRCYPRRLSVA